MHSELAKAHARSRFTRYLNTLCLLAFFLLPLTLLGPAGCELPPDTTIGAGDMDSDDSTADGTDADANSNEVDSTATNDDTPGDGDGSTTDDVPAQDSAGTPIDRNICTPIEGSCGQRTVRTAPRNTTVEQTQSFSDFKISGDANLLKAVPTIGLAGYSGCEENIENSIGPLPSTLIQVDADGIILNDDGSPSTTRLDAACGCVVPVSELDGVQDNEPLDFNEPIFPFDDSGSMEPAPLCPEGEVAIRESGVFAPGGSHFCAIIDSEICIDCYEDETGWHLVWTLEQNIRATSGAEGFSVFDLCSQTIEEVDIAAGAEASVAQTIDLAYLR